MTKKKRINPIIKFRRFWKTLNDVEQSHMWNIFTALRGQDEEHDYPSAMYELKYQLTARIRGELIGKTLTKITNDNTGCFIEPVERKPLYDVTVVFQKCSNHFIKHNRQAIKSLISLGGIDRIVDLLKFIEEVD